MVFLLVYWQISFPRKMIIFTRKCGGTQNCGLIRRCILESRVLYSKEGNVTVHIIAFHVLFSDGASLAV